MDADLSPLLDGWPYDPHELNVRVVETPDGEQKIQLRVELGVLQMNRDGRPDGKTFGDNGDCESYLDLLEAEVAPNDDLTFEQVEELYREGLQYYRRYLAFFHLEWFEFLVRDTDRNLRLLKFVRKHARRKKDRWRFDQFRPYLLMMNARGRAMNRLAVGDRVGAQQAVDVGKGEIVDFLAEYGRSPQEVECRELDMLERFGEEIRTSQTPTGPTEIRRSLQEKLRQAVDREDYEQAALLRDRLRTLGAAVTDEE
jgi:hypothetical protein